MAELTPMKRQYNEIKEKHKRIACCFSDWAIFTRCLTRDAKLAARGGPRPTTRDRGVEDPEARTPMCGVPYQRRGVHRPAHRKVQGRHLRADGGPRARQGACGAGGHTHHLPARSRTAPCLSTSGATIYARSTSVPGSGAGVLRHFHGRILLRGVLGEDAVGAHRQRAGRFPRARRC